MKTILFVCVANSGRSQMAEAFFNQMTTGEAMAVSAGTNPAGSVDSVVAGLMDEIGIDISKQKPKLLTAEMAEMADRVISMGCGVAESCPADFVISEDWGLDDPKGQPRQKMEAIRDEIQARVKKLLKEIEKEK